MEDGLVLYRKYRPRGFDEVVGQESVVRALVNALATGRLSHAYLFSGPHGVGKTTLARLIAKAVNCVQAGKSGAPCNACESCERYNQGTTFGVIEIDAASNRGIDEIRELREVVRFAPAEGGKKTYIIDEVHMLTAPAFNALLKTLEEPPEHAMFVLATTELDKVPATIISRTQHYQLKRPTFEMTSERLLFLAQKEGARLDREAAALIAVAAEGSLRDSEGILGKVLAVEPGHITEEIVRHTLGLPRREAVFKVYEALVEKNVKSALASVRDVVDAGYDITQFTKQLVRLSRSVAMAAIDPEAASAFERGFPQDADRIKNLARTADFSHLTAVLQVLADPAITRRSAIPELPLELAVIRLAAAEAPILKHASQSQK